MTARTITDQDHARVSRAISNAEATTSGEIYCVVAQRSASYFYAASFVVFVALLLVSMGAAFFLEARWLTMRLPLFVAAQCLAAATALAVIALFPGFRLLLVPRRLQYLRAHENAVKQFLARNVHMTTERTGVLLFVSLAEHYAEVIADSGINSKVEQEEWEEIVRELVAHARREEIAGGFEAAVGMVGNLLAKHFPPKAVNPNELNDHLVEI